MRQACFAILLLAFAAHANADTTYVSGSVEGIWTTLGNPYIATGSLVVESGNELTIEPGVRIEFRGGQRLTVYGRLVCEGTDVTPVLFTQDTVRFPTRWAGLTFANQTGVVSVLNNVIVEYAQSWDGVIRVIGGLPEIYGLELRNNPSHGIYIQNDTLLLEDCIIHSNGSGGGCGAALRAHDSQILIRNSQIKYNLALDGGALCIYDSEITVDSTLFLGNKGQIWGGVLYADNSNVRFSNCVFDSNLSLSGGVAHLVVGGDATFEYCVFFRNQSRHDGYTGSYGAVYSPTNGTKRFMNCLFYQNWGQNGRAVYSTGNTSFFQCAFAENDGVGPTVAPDADTVRYTAFHPSANMLGAPPNFGIFVAENANGDSIDIYGNLVTPPVFDPSGPNGQFSLHHTSHWINAGDPNGPPDEDGTTPDLGPYPFYRLQQIDDLTIARIAGTDNISLRWTEVPEAVEYWVFQTTSGEFSWDSALLIGTNTAPVYVHEGAVADPALQTTYVVIASQVPASMALLRLNR